MAQREASFIGVGTIYIRLKGGTKGLQRIGNCSELSYSFEEDKKEMKDYENAGGGNKNVITRISNFTGSLKVHDYTADSLALALRGEAAVVTTGTVTDEAHTSLGVDGEFIPFDFTPDMAETVTVKKTDNTALAVNTDYTLGHNGIVVVGDGGIDATGVKISYTKAASEVMEALVESGQEFELFMDGLNEAQSGKPVSVRNHRVKFSPTSGLGFLGGEFGEIPLEFEVLSDSTIVGAGLSKFMKVQQAT